MPACCGEPGHDELVGLWIGWVARLESTSGRVVVLSEDGMSILRLEIRLMRSVVEIVDSNGKLCGLGRAMRQR